MDSRELYIGLDLSTEYAMVSTWTRGQMEPLTISPVAGSEVYQIPIMLCKRRGIGQWFYGEEARRMADLDEGICVDQLWMRALRKEHIRIEETDYTAMELLGLYIRKVLSLPEKLSVSAKIVRLVISILEMNHDTMAAVAELMTDIGIEKEQYRIIDHQESFYYYVLSQREELNLHDVALFDYNGDNMEYVSLKWDRNTTPHLVTMREKNYGPLIGNKDISFLDVSMDALQKRVFSSVYLIGDGFDGDWMKESIRFLCNARHVFMGKNMYSKGAAYAAGIDGKLIPWEYAYIGDNEMKLNLSIKVLDEGELSFYTLINAGENWYEAEGTCEILLGGSADIDFWMQEVNSREARIESLELTDLPKRPERTTRLRISAKPLSDESVKVTIRDLGFGEIYPGTEKRWEYVISR